VLPHHISLVAGSTFNQAFEPCPARCINNGISPSNWTVYHHTSRLAWCNETMLLDFTIYNSLDDPNTHKSIRTCTTESNSDTFQGQLSPKTSCPFAVKNPVEVSAAVEMAWVDSSTSGNSDQAVAAAQQVQNFWTANTEASCHSAIVFGYSGQAVVGIYAGAEIKNQPFTNTILQNFIDHIQSEGLSESLLVQLCQADNRGSDYAFGIVANTNSSLSSVQNIVRTWSDGDCVTAHNGAFTWKRGTILAPAIPINGTLTPGTSGNSSTNSTSVAARHLNSYNKLHRHHYYHKH